jgi:hypothetical protein
MPQRSDVDSLLDATIISHEARDLDRAESLYLDVPRAKPNPRKRPVCAVVMHVAVPRTQSDETSRPHSYQRI